MPIFGILSIYRVKSPYKSKSLFTGSSGSGNRSVNQSTGNDNEPESLLESDIAYNSIRSRFYKAGLS
jgi:hypothetical protein